MRIWNYYLRIWFCHSPKPQLSYYSKVCTRAHSNIQTLVSFLIKMVKELDLDDWGKLRDGLRYLEDTHHMKWYISTKSLTSVH